MQLTSYDLGETVKRQAAEITQKDKMIEYYADRLRIAEEEIKKLEERLRQNHSASKVIELAERRNPNETL